MPTDTSLQPTANPAHHTVAPAARPASEGTVASTTSATALAAASGRQRVVRELRLRALRSELVRTRRRLARSERRLERVRTHYEQVLEGRERDATVTFSWHDAASL